MADLIIRQAEEKDVPAIEEIEKQCFTVPWSYESLHKDIVENGLAFYVVAQTDGRVCAYGKFSTKVTLQMWLWPLNSDENISAGPCCRP